MAQVPSVSVFCQDNGIPPSTELMYDLPALLLQFKRETEWFFRPDLFRMVRRSDAGRELLDRRLRHWLYSRGVAWPWPFAGSGQPPLPLFTFLFFTGGGRQHREHGLARVLQQAAGVSEAALVVFNLSPYILTDVSGVGPPSTLVVDLHPSLPVEGLPGGSGKPYPVPLSPANLLTMTDLSEDPVHRPRRRRGTVKRAE